jgi:hypothetical protein
MQNRLLEKKWNFELDSETSVDYSILCVAQCTCCWNASHCCHIDWNVTRSEFQYGWPCCSSGTNSCCRTRLFVAPSAAEPELLRWQLTHDLLYNRQLLIMQFSPYLSSVQISSSAPCFRTPLSPSSLNVRDQASHPYRTTGKIIVLHMLIIKLSTATEKTEGSGPNGSKHYHCII